MRGLTFDGKFDLFWINRKVIIFLVKYKVNDSLLRKKLYKFQFFYFGIDCFVYANVSDSHIICWLRELRNFVLYHLWCSNLKFDFQLVLIENVELYYSLFHMIFTSWFKSQTVVNFKLDFIHCYEFFLVLN